jgi:translation initiation factor IF-2
MTTPNAFTRSTLVGVAGHVTHALTDLDAVLPHMRAVALSATGVRAASAQRALEEAERVADELRELDRRAEAAKVLFRSATTGSAGALEASTPQPVHTCPPALLALTDYGPAAHPGSGAVSV